MPVRLFTLSQCTLKQGQRWFRLGWHGPGLRIIDTRSRGNPFPFSLRYGHMRALRFGPYAIVWLPAFGDWPFGKPHPDG